MSKVEAPTSIFEENLKAKDERLGFNHRQSLNLAKEGVNNFSEKLVDFKSPKHAFKYSESL